MAAEFRREKCSWNPDFMNRKVVNAGLVHITSVEHLDGATT